jgi:hypothetical protein
MCALAAPSRDVLSMSTRSEAQARIDQIQAFRRELASVQADGTISLKNDAKRSMTYHGQWRPWGSK